MTFRQMEKVSWRTLLTAGSPDGQLKTTPGWLPLRNRFGMFSNECPVQRPRPLDVIQEAWPSGMPYRVSIGAAPGSSRTVVVVERPTTVANDPRRPAVLEVAIFMAIIRVGLPTLLLRRWVVRLNPRITDMPCRLAVAEIPELMTSVRVGLPA